MIFPPNVIPLPQNLDGLSVKCEAIVTILAAKPGKFVLARHMVSAIYADDPDGGPLDAQRSVSKIIRYHRERLAKCGLRIESRQGRDGGFRLHLITPKGD